MCVLNQFKDRYPDGSRVEYAEMSLCKYGRPGHPCSMLRIMDMPTRKIKYSDGTTSIRSKRRYQPVTPPRSPSSGSPRTRRLSNHEESADEGPLRHKARNDSSTRKSDRRTHRRERREPQERIVVVDAPRTPSVPSRRYSRLPTPPSSPDDPVYYSRGRPVVVDERRVRRLPRSPTPYHDEEHRRFSDGINPRDRGRPIIRRSYSRPDVRYDWSSPPRGHTTWIVGERRGRRKSYGGREVRDRRSSWSDHERRGRRASFSDQEIWEKKEKRSPFTDPVGEVRTGKRRVRRLSASGDREEQKETRSLHSDPERERRRARRERRASSSDPGKEHRRRERRASSSDQEKDQRRRERRASSSDQERDQRRRERRASSSDQERDQRRRERRASSSDQERDQRRRERRAALTEAEREDKRERRTSVSDPEKEQRRERRRSPVADADREEGKERRSIVADPEREARKERRQRRATFSEYDRAIVEEAPLHPQSERLSHTEVRSSYSDPGRQTSPEREREERRRRRHNREVRNYQESERRRARLITEQNDRIVSRPSKPSGSKALKPILKQTRTEPYPDPGDGPQQPVKAVTIDETNVIDAGAALERRQDDRGKMYRKRLEDLDREAQKRRLKDRMTRSASVDRYRDRDVEEPDERPRRRRSSKGVAFDDENHPYEA